MLRITIPVFGALGFKCGDDLFGRTIENLTGADDAFTPSHVFIVGQNGEIFEAWLRARVQKLSKYDDFVKRGRIEFYKPQGPEEATVRAYNFIVQTYKGTPYGIPQIGGHLLVELAKKLGRNIKNPTQAGLVCHEAGVRYLQRFNFESHMLGEHTDCEWADLIDPEQENPRMLRDRCRGTFQEEIP